MTIKPFLIKSLVIPLLLLAILVAGCKKLVEVDAPYTSINTSNVYATDPTAIAVLTGIYAQMSNPVINTAGISGMSYYGGLSADEFSLNSGTATATQLACWQNAQNAQSAVVDVWTNIYPYIYDVNAAIIGLTNSSSLTPAVKQQLLGEALFLRAFYYFYLTNYYGNVPLVLGTDYTQNSNVAPTAQNLVYAQIIQDLNNARSMLVNGYVDATIIKASTERTRPNRAVAAALLSRVYLYTGQWQNAINMADSVITNGNYSLIPMSSGPSITPFTKNNNEAIWQWQPVAAGFNTGDARVFIIPSTGFNTQNNVSLSSGLINSFETGDRRFLNWVGNVTISGKIYYYPYKYRVNQSGAPVTEYTTIFRLAEQYLIRAEAEAQLSQLTAATNDLNTIRNRAGLPNTTAVTQTGLLNAILQERRIELFSEWGHRWLDLKRTSNLNAVMGTGGACAAKGGTWNPNWALYPINVVQIQRDPSLLQNSGY